MDTVTESDMAIGMAVRERESLFFLLCYYYLLLLLIAKAN